MPQRWKFAQDPGNTGVARGLALAEFDDASWVELDGDRPFEAQGFAGYDGYCWYRCTITIPEHVAASMNPPGETDGALLELGFIDDIDEVYINGIRVGGSGLFPPLLKTAWNERRNYPIRPGVFKAGINHLAIRVFDEMGDGGLRGGALRLWYGSKIATLISMKTRRATGFPAANFSLAMELSPDGTFPARIWNNPPVAGAWFDEIALGNIAFREGSVSVSARDALAGQVQRQWPFGSARYASDQIKYIIFDLETFCPLARSGDPFWSALPLGFAKFTITNRSPDTRNVEIEWTLLMDGETRNVVADEQQGRTYSGVDGDRLSLRTTAAAGTFTGDQLKVFTNKFKLEPGESRDAYYCFALSPKTSRQALDTGTWPSSPELAILGLQQAAAARNSTLQIDGWIPRTGDSLIDEALRWYCGAAVQLTKISTNGTTAVMAYSEMTVRDSFWGTFLHNILFPELERRMIGQIFGEQRADGKVPTTVLPSIERESDLDTNALAMLRAFRYAQWNGDTDFLKQIAANLKGAALWLGKRDTNGDGLPEGGTRWTDWKEAPGMAGRLLSPYAAFLYIAALQQLERAMTLGRDRIETITEIRSRLEKATATVNAPADRGGLWGGSHYIERWAQPPASSPVESEFLANRSPSIVNEDQVVGILFHTIPAERTGVVLDTLARNRVPFGVRESFPYRTLQYGHRPGDFTNGAVWPWLNYADAWARFEVGRPAEALAILRDVASNDLFHSGAAIPHECLDGNTGEPMRNAPQLWNATFFAAVFHGLFGVRRDETGLLTIAPRALPARGWRVRAPLPEGEVEVTDGHGAEAPQLRWFLTEPLPVRIQLPGRQEYQAILPPGPGGKDL